MSLVGYAHHFCFNKDKKMKQYSFAEWYKEGREVGSRSLFMHTNR
jgi:hypothetical protein